MKGKKHVDMKRVGTILLVALFVVIMMISFVLLTTVRKIEVKFAVLENVNADVVQARLNKYVGDNIILVNDDELKYSLADFSYVDVVSVDKVFPNIISVTIKERREIYSIETEEEVLIVNEEGYLLRTTTKTEHEQTRDMIKLNFGKLNVVEKNIGQVVKTDSDELFLSVLDMAKSVNLTNCIKEISIIKYDAKNELSDVEFETYTGVKICVQKAEEMGVEKVQRAFEVYDEKVSDYEKASDTLYAFYNLETERIDVTWSDRNVGEQ